MKLTELELMVAIRNFKRATEDHVHSIWNDLTDSNKDASPNSLETYKIYKSLRESLDKIEEEFFK